MIPHPYTEQLIIRQRQREMMEKAERQRVVRQVIRWIKKTDATPSDTIDMRLPKVNVSQN